MPCCLDLPLRPVFFIPLIVAFALFMENLDGTVLSTALPAIAADLHEDPIALKLAMTSYFLSLAAFIPASGWVADRFGSRTVFRSAIIVFMTGSLLCGISSNLPQFIGARFIQGMGGAMMVPVGRLILLRSVPRSELVRALAYLTLPAMLGPVMGPVLGGFITTYFHWRWIFWINIPIGVLGIILISLYIPQIKEAVVPKFDLTGFMLSGFALAVLDFGTTTLGRDFFPDQFIYAMLIAGLVALGFYIRHALRVANPILDLRLLRLKTFRSGVIGGFLFRIGIGALPFLLPLLFQLNFGLTPFQSGSLTFAAAVGAMAMKPTAGPILRRFGFRNVLIWNAVISSGFLAAYSLFNPSLAHWIIITLLLVGGFFRSLEFTALNAVSFAEIDETAMSKATSFSSVAQQLSQSVGVSVGATALELAHLYGHETIFALGNFQYAFVVIGVISIASVLIFKGLPKNAGADISGHAS